MLLNIHRIDSNIGDIMSSPLRHFNFPKGSTNIDIMTIDNIEVLKNDIIVGGGGLIARDFFEEKMQYIASNKKGRLISWGAGHNSYQTRIGQSLIYPKYMDSFDLHGIRDYEQGFNYVPCASCMSKLFDKKYSVKHEFVIYRHSNSRWPIVENHLNFPTMTNDRKKASGSRMKIANIFKEDEVKKSFKEIIKFLGEAETILTNTYHGMYWGILLKKRVIAFPFSSKFYTLKYKVPVCSPNEWLDYLPRTSIYPEALEECRKINNDYYHKVMNLIR